MGPAHPDWSRNAPQTRPGAPHRTGTIRPGIGASIAFRVAAQPKDGGMSRNANLERLGDFTTSPRVIPVSLLAIGIGVVSTLVAGALLRLIGFFTNIFFYGRLSTTFV